MLIFFNKLLSFYEQFDNFTKKKACYKIYSVKCGFFAVIRESTYARKAGIQKQPKQ